MEIVGVYMSPNRVVTEEMILAAFSALDERIAHPPPVTQKKYSRREAFMKLRTKAQAALAAGHSLQTVLDDLKGIGLELAVSTARQYLKPCKNRNKSKGTGQVNAQDVKREKRKMSEQASPVTHKGTFTVVDDDKDI